MPVWLVGVRFCIVPLIKRNLEQAKVKNSLVFAALLFDKRVFDLDALWHSFAAVLVFCGVSSAIYLVNDVRKKTPAQTGEQFSSRPLILQAYERLVMLADRISPLRGSTTVLLLSSFEGTQRTTE